MRHLKLWEELHIGNGCPLDNEVDKQEIIELCEPFMIPLMDDDVFEYGTISSNMGRYPFIVVYISRKDKQDFRWCDVKDNVIPMFHMLCKSYMPDEWSVETGQQVHFYEAAGKTTRYYVEDLIFDGKEGPSDGKQTKVVGLKLYQKRNWWGTGMRFPGESRR